MAFYKEAIGLMTLIVSKEPHSAFLIPSMLKINLEHMCISISL